MTTTLWHDRARNLAIDGRALIDGQRVWAKSGATFDDISPVDGRSLGPVARCDVADVDAAVAAARNAFEDRRWAGLAPAARKRVMIKFADLIVANRDELALLETLDMGKPIKYSLSVDVNGTANCIRWYGEAVDKVYDEIAPTPEHCAGADYARAGRCGRRDRAVELSDADGFMENRAGAGSRQQRGAQAVGKIAADRVAAGRNRAASRNSARRIQCAAGYGHEAGSALALHMDVDCIAFTGSTKVGKLIVQYAGQSNLKRAWTELGGKSPNIVCADCPDLDAAVSAAVGSIYFNQGESCNAPSRLFVEASIKDKFLEKALAMVPDFQPGDPLDENTVMGAIVDGIQLKSVLGFIESGKEQGAQLLAGGEQARTESGGYYVTPTIFDQVGNDMRIAREEIFGPVLSVLSFTDLNEAIRAANATSFGLQAAVWTSDIRKAHQTARALRVGTVHVNQYDEDDMTVPFGGFKQSGNGRDKSLHAFDKYTEMKTTWIRIV